MILATADLYTQNENSEIDTLKFKNENMDKSSANETNAENTVRSLIDAMSENNAQNIRSLFNDNAKQAYGNGGWKSGNDFFKWLQSDIIDRKGYVDNAKFETKADQVVVTGQYSSEGYTSKANFLFEVENDKIISWQMRY